MNTNNEKYEEKIDNFTDNELINIKLDSKNEKLVELNFNTDDIHKEVDIFYTIQKGDKILFNLLVVKVQILRKVIELI